MSNLAIDFEKKNALEEARMRVASAAPFNVPQKGQADNYPSDNSIKRPDISQLLDASKKAQEAAKLATPVGAISLMKKINLFSDMPYVMAMGAALLKDLIDLLASETVIFGVLFSVLCSIFIFMMMLLVGSGGKKKQAKGFLKKILTLVAGGVADAVPFLGWIPIETATVAIIYVMVLMERDDE
jgi:hypothetical protein